jgi:hypothetical protein
MKFDRLHRAKHAFWLIESIKNKLLVGERAHRSTFEPRIFPSELKEAGAGQQAAGSDQQQ